MSPPPPEKPNAADAFTIRARRGLHSVDLGDGFADYLAVASHDVDGSERALVVSEREACWICGGSLFRSSLTSRYRRLDLLGLAGEELYMPSQVDDPSLDRRIRDAFEGGRIVLLRLPREEPTIVHLRAPAPPPSPSPAARPRPAPPDRIFRYPIVVIDDTGVPVSGVRLQFDLEGTPRMVTSGPDGATTAEWIEDVTGTVKVLDLPMLATRLAARWTKPVTGAQGAIQRVNADAGEFAVRSALRTTIVLARPRSWIGLTLTDQDGTPVPCRAYRIVTTGGAVFDAELDDQGTALVEDVESGTCQVFCPYVEPHPALTHVVRAGEHLSGIAQALGFDDYAVVWNRPENAALRELRGDPHVLSPGDELFVPELRDSPVSKTPGTKYAFSIRRTPLKLRLKLLGLATKGIADAKLTVANDPLTTDANGTAVVPIEKSEKDVTMTARGQDLALEVGSLDPAEEDVEEGWRARLFNLGFLLDQQAVDDDDEMVIALQDFQTEFGLPLSGQPDDATKAKLQEVYGA